MMCGDGDDSKSAGNEFGVEVEVDSGAERRRWLLLRSRFIFPWTRIADPKRRNGCAAWNGRQTRHSINYYGCVHRGTARATILTKATDRIRQKFPA